MAAPRCMRSFLGPAKRVKISQPPRPHARTFSQTKGSRADEDEGRGDGRRGRREGKAMTKLLDDIESGNLDLEAQLNRMNIDPKKYKELYNSSEKAEQRLAEWEPKTREEAQQKWKEMQDTPDHFTLLHTWKRAGVEPIKVAKERGITLPTDKPPLDPKTQEELDALRKPLNVQAVNLRPLRRAAPYGVPVCDLQLRTYSIRQLVLFADFCVRAAYYMGLPARGPVPLPRITERWTVPRANFIFKKSQENFERITMRRLIQIQDGDPDVVKAWLAFVTRYQVPGVGMKANIWEYESLESATRAGYELPQGDFSRRREGSVMRKVEEILGSEGFKESMQGHESGVEMRP
ncbi:hypothetical protein HBI56_113670 [Parastagonospora nodorum]|uniref:Small ribosomal subunit protein uS10m n=1 Tax=Phaeosphaeria nodorum (strain SN15 / ATCC MYA-4574 / FGSC 10173) TaxID=321614 RepID=A0A7U2FA40_PHANO|nr:hypothetical protein HBH56_194510 [Parastagonospora nodorum]QRD00459.1 hypothetical protein JI435_090230 [Parastagonospora nodorum SN15]KAH3924937.1 hypothetical protein HBH54_189000 [Parastagonospora nodorum]KAH3976461.1 hypothetical protein HBH52_117370 [Parastagonospora nodorum]KAH3984424.1 hypothetical protein HBH51_031270 [Parastagonospora nodorum]